MTNMARQARNRTLIEWMTAYSGLHHCSVWGWKVTEKSLMFKSSLGNKRIPLSRILG